MDQRSEEQRNTTVNADQQLIHHTISYKQQNMQNEEDVALQTGQQTSNTLVTIEPASAATPTKDFHLPDDENSENTGEVHTHLNEKIFKNKISTENSQLSKNQQNNSSQNNSLETQKVATKKSAPSMESSLEDVNVESIVVDKTQELEIEGEMRQDLPEEQQVYELQECNQFPQPQIPETSSIEFPQVPKEYEFAILPGEQGDPRLKTQYQLECQQNLIQLFVEKIPINPCPPSTLNLGPKKMIGFKPNNTSHNYGIKKMLKYQTFDTRKRLAEIQAEKEKELLKQQEQASQQNSQANASFIRSSRRPQDADTTTSQHSLTRASSQKFNRNAQIKQGSFKQEKPINIIRRTGALTRPSSQSQTNGLYTGFDSSPERDSVERIQSNLKAMNVEMLGQRPGTSIGKTRAGELKMIQEENTKDLQKNTAAPPAQHIYIKPHTANNPGKRALRQTGSQGKLISDFKIRQRERSEGEEISNSQERSMQNQNGNYKNLDPPLIVQSQKAEFVSNTELIPQRRGADQKNQFRFDSNRTNEKPSSNGDEAPYEVDQASIQMQSYRTKQSQGTVKSGLTSKIAQRRMSSQQNGRRSIKDFGPYCVPKAGLDPQIQHNQIGSDEYFKQSFAQLPQNNQFKRDYRGNLNRRNRTSSVNQLQDNNSLPPMNLHGFVMDQRKSLPPQESNGEIADLLYQQDEGQRLNNDSSYARIFPNQDSYTRLKRIKTADNKKKNYSLNQKALKKLQKLRATDAALTIYSLKL